MESQTARRTNRKPITKPSDPITHLLISGSWVEVATPINADRANFLITCDYGDWSGFRTLAECLAQIPAWQGKRNGFYKIEVR